MRHPETRGGDETKDAGRDPGHLARAARRLGLLGALAILPLVAVAGPGVGAAMAAEPEIPPIVVIEPGGRRTRRLRNESARSTPTASTPTTTSNTARRPPTAPTLPVPDGDAGTSARSAGLTGRHRRPAEHDLPLPACRDQLERARLQHRREHSPPPADPTIPPPPAPEPPPTSGGGSSKSVQQGQARQVSRVTRSSPRRAAAPSTASAPRRTGKFICTKASGCLAIWHPLMVPKDGTVERSREAGHRSSGPMVAVPGDLPRASALHLRRGHQTRPGGRSGPQGRRHLARGQGPEAEALAAEAARLRRRPASGR